MSLSPLFEFTWQVDPDADTVIPPDGRDGVHLSDGIGTRGFGLRLETRAPVWSINGSLRMFTTDARCASLADGLYVFEGEFDENTGRAAYRVLRQDA